MVCDDCQGLVAVGNHGEQIDSGIIFAKMQKIRSAGVNLFAETAVSVYEAKVLARVRVVVSRPPRLLPEVNCRNS